jgi:glycine/D-amino acid oxidase-like deaminating enzyme
MSTAILGAGMLGVCTALELAERGHHVTLFDRQPEPLCEASLHNEGKLHLGFVYAADPSFRTAARMIRGAGCFAARLSRWIPAQAWAELTADPFDYVVHRDTQVPVARIERHFAQVESALAPLLSPTSGPSPLCRDRPVWRRLSASELETRYAGDLVAAAYETCEIAVDTWAVAAHLRRAVLAHPKVQFAGGMRVVTTCDRSDGRYDVVCAAPGEARSGPFDAVVNALWANRAAVDRRYGLVRDGAWLTRHKLCVSLMRPAAMPAAPSATIVLGPFGDIVWYRSGRVYLSWYPSCLAGATTADDEFDWTAMRQRLPAAAVGRRTLEALARICPAVHALGGGLEDGRVDGGAICARGATDIDDPVSGLHQRLETGIDGRGRYLSADTGKYTTAPLIAAEIAARLAALGATG